MSRRRRHLIGWTACVAVVTCLVLVLVSCGSRLPEDDASVTALVAQWVPVGTPVADAQRILEEHDFETALYPARSQFNKEPDDLLWGDRHQSAGWPVQRRFQVMLTVVDGRVAAVRVTSALVGL